MTLVFETIILVLSPPVSVEICKDVYNQGISILKWGGGGTWCETEPLACGIYFQVESAKMDLYRDSCLFGDKNPYI